MTPREKLELELEPQRQQEEHRQQDKADKVEVSRELPAASQFVSLALADQRAHPSREPDQGGGGAEISARPLPEKASGAPRRAPASTKPQKRHPRHARRQRARLGRQFDRRPSPSQMSHDMAKSWGRLERDELRSGETRWRIALGVVDVRGERKRRRVSTSRAPDFIPFADERDALVELDRIRARAINGESREQIVESYLPELVEEQRFENWVERYVGHFKRLCETGDRSWNSLRDLERWTKANGYWRWWDGRDIREFTNADATAFTTWLADQPSRSNRDEGRKLTAKTRKNVVDGLRAFLVWASQEAATGAGQAWPVPILRSPRSECPSTPTIPVEVTRQILAEIPWEIRGAFLAAAYESARFSTIAAATLGDYDPATAQIYWHRARQGHRVDAPIGGQKNRRRVRREVWSPDLREWLDWRIEQVTAADRIAGRASALFWNPAAHNRAKAWTYDPFRAAWARAAALHGLTTVPPQAGTRHSILSRLGEVLTPTALQAHSMHASASSLAHYTTGTKANHAVMMRAVHFAPRLPHGPSDGT